jgi:N-acetyl-alpha-D-glucosaminyl L-malate synthase BshA
MAGSPLRIGIVCYPTVGGSSVIATEVALHAAAFGHDVHLISYDRPHRLRASTPGVTFHCVQVAGYPLLKFPPYDLALATRMLEVHEDAGVDLFHVHYAIPHAVSAFLARSIARDRLRFITTLHGTDITVVGADRAYARPTSFAIEQSDAVTAVSRFLAQETERIFGTGKAIHVIPNFVDTQRFTPGRGTRYYQRPNEERIIFHASNFRPVKRVADVVRAFAIIAGEVPARLLLVGDGPDREHALAVAADLGCLDRIEHVGNQAAPEALLADADLCLMASETESFGLVLLEAMSCGVPGASTDVGGVREVLGETGMYAPVARPELLARAALPCLQQPDLHQRLATEARERTLANFEQSKILDLYFDLYRDVLSQL